MGSLLDVLASPGIAFLPYLKMGVALTDVQASVLDACSGDTCGVRSVRARNDSTKPSWAVGGGLEYALSQNWIVKGEYLFIGLGLHDRLRVSGPGLGTVGGSTWVWSQDLSSVHTGKMV
ncbi:MAG TPA: hypothetical protein VFY96_05770 [Candidatus Binatia bacterium]|nr:hypothetical protein [Candidatus Binatia bacterium]